MGVLHYVIRLAALALSRLGGEPAAQGLEVGLMHAELCCLSTGGLVVLLPYPGGPRQISSGSRLTHILTLR